MAVAASFGRLVVVQVVALVAGPVAVDVVRVVVESVPEFGPPGARHVVSFAHSMACTLQH